MILKETILSAFTERGTLLKWLKKVEAALNNAVLSDISVEQVSATQVKLKFTFENGDFVESPVLTLPRGEKGEPGKDGAPGKDGLDGEGIAATIEVGTVTTGAAGTNASVTNVGTEQRAILNFVIPRGEEGSTGAGFDDASNIEIIPSPLLSSAQNGFNLSGTMKVTAGDEIFEIPSTMLLPLTSNGSIIIDVAEDGRSIEIHLDADIAAKLGRVLVTPMSAPASVSLVAVDTSNTQTMLTLGDGLSVSGGVLSASGGASLYSHIIELRGTKASGANTTINLRFVVNVICARDAKFTNFDEFFSYLKNSGLYPRQYIASGVALSTTDGTDVVNFITNVSIGSATSIGLNVYGVNPYSIRGSVAQFSTLLQAGEVTAFSDTVILL